MKPVARAPACRQRNSSPCRGALLRACAVALLSPALALRGLATVGRAPGVYEAVLRRYCSPALVQEYEGLPGAARRELLAALEYVVEGERQNDMVGDLVNESSSGHVSGMFSAELERASATAADPLAQALSGRVLQRTLDRLRKRILPKWGVQKPAPFALAMHELILNERRKELANPEKPQVFSTGGTVAERSGRRHIWKSLRSISATGLPLFQVATGRVLEGKLIVDPVVSVGITTILADDWGSIVQLGLYNALPGGASGGAAWGLATKKFSKGTRLRIAEPYLKIFRDGNRGVRVDDPADLGFDSDDMGQAGLSKTKEEGNALFAENHFHAASGAYWSGLKAGSGDVVVLLSNRAQALLKQERWTPALQDAAAAVLLDPAHKKSWLRYEAALRGLGPRGGGSARARRPVCRGGQRSGRAARDFIRAGRLAESAPRLGRESGGSKPRRPGQ